MIDEYSNNEFNILISEVKECLNSSSSFDVDYFLKLLSEQEFLEIIESIYKNDYHISSDIIERAVRKEYRACDVQAIIDCMQNGFFESEIPPIYACVPNERIERKVDLLPQNTQKFDDRYFCCVIRCEEEVGNNAVCSLKISSNLYNVKQLYECISSLCRAKKTYIDENNAFFVSDKSSEHKDIPEKFTYTNEFTVDELREDNVIIIHGDENDLDEAFELVRIFEWQKRENIVSENEYVKLQRKVNSLGEYAQEIKLGRIIEDDQHLRFLKDNGICLVKDIMSSIPHGIDNCVISELKNGLNNIDGRTILQATNEILKILPPREEVVLRRRYFGEKIDTLESIGAIYNVSRERVRQVELDAKRRIAKYKAKKKCITRILRLHSQYKNFFTEKELIAINLPRTFGIFLEAIMDEVFWDPDYSVGFYNQQLCKLVNQEFELLPNELLVSELEEYAKEASQSIGNNIEWQEIAYLIRQKYREVGDFLVKGRLTLRVVLAYLIRKYFPDGLDVYEEENIQFLREKAKEHFDGFELAENNHAITSRIQAFCAPVARGVWKWASDESLLDNQLKEDISTYIETYNAPIVPIHAIFLSFEERLSDVDIYNKYHLQGELKKFLDKKYTVNRDYVFKDVETSFYTVLESFVKEAKTLVTKKDILREFPGINDITIQQACASTKILNMNGYFVHLDNLAISEDEKDLLKCSIDELLTDDNIYHAKNVFVRIRGINSGLFNRIGIEHYLQFYYLIKELFPNSYEYNRPFLAHLGVNIISGEAQVLEKMSSKAEVEISDIRQFAREVGTIIDRYIEFVDRNSDIFVFKNGHSVITLEAAGIYDDEFTNIDEVIADFVDDSPYKNLCEFFDYWRLPKLNTAWNEWLLYSLINKYSRKFKGVVSSNYLNEAIPFVAKLEVKLEDIDFSNVEKTDTVDEKKTDLEDLLDFDDLE